MRDVLVQDDLLILQDINVRGSDMHVDENAGDHHAVTMKLSSTCKWMAMPMITVW
jgi:hypothetical protein